MAANYNSQAQAFRTKAQMLNEVMSISKVPSEDCMMPIECNPSQTTDQGLLFVRNGLQLPSNAGDAKLYDIGNFYIASQGTTLGVGQTSVTLGELHVTYEVCLYKPQLPDNITSNVVQPQAIAIALDAGRFVPQTPFAGFILKSDTIGVTVDPSTANGIQFDSTVIGTFSVSFTADMVTADQNMLFVHQEANGARMVSLNNSSGTQGGVPGSFAMMNAIIALDGNQNALKQLFLFNWTSTTANVLLHTGVLSINQLKVDPLPTVSTSLAHLPSISTASAKYYSSTTADATPLKGMTMDVDNIGLTISDTVLTLPVHAAGKYMLITSWQGGAVTNVHPAYTYSSGIVAVNCLSDVSGNNAGGQMANTALALTTKDVSVRIFVVTDSGSAETITLGASGTLPTSAKADLVLVCLNPLVDGSAVTL
ncbi:capsid protein [Crucivirus-540]|nr:capsid protein [Crucivirus-540]